MRDSEIYIENSPRKTRIKKEIMFGQIPLLKAFQFTYFVE